MGAAAKALMAATPRRRPGLTLPRQMRWRFPFPRGWSPRARRIWFVAHNRNHVRLFADAADLLAGDGHRVAFADLELFYGNEGASQEVRSRGRDSRPFAEVARRAGAGDKIVVANDWGPPPLVAGLVAAVERGALLIGLVEGAKAAEPRRYRLVHRMLALGPASARLFDVPTDIVGSPILDQAFASAAVSAEPRFAVINDKFVYDARDLRAAWLNAAQSACMACGLAPLVSPHPSGAAVSTESEFAALIRRAALLVTRPSTVVFEAMALGKPVVLFPVAGEPLYEFADAGPALETCDDAGALEAGVRRALAAAPAHRERCRTFLEDHVAYDPREPAAARIAAAVARAER